MRRFLLPLVFLLVGTYVQAQIIVVHFKDEKIAKRYKKATIETADGFVIIGEPIEGGGVVIADNGGIGFAGRTGAGSNGQADTSNSFYLFNVDDPTDVPYTIRNGEKKLVRKKAKVVVNGLDVESMNYFSQSEDIYSLATEYRFRLGRLEDIEADRKQHKKGEPAWFEAHNALLLEYSRLENWLREVGYFGAARKLGKTIKREAKMGKGDATRARRTSAENSVKQVAPPKDLQEAARKLDPALTFSCFESEHFVFNFPTGRWDTATMEKAVKFAETVLDGFRVEFVDPYIGEDFKDRVPHGLQIMEFMFVPEAQFEDMLVDYYQHNWTDERSKGMGGSSFTRRFSPRSVKYIRVDGKRDLESTITYFLGKTLSALHFGSGYVGMSQDWIREGLAYYLSFEYCGRSTWTTVDWSNTGYAKGGRKEGEKTVQQGLRAMFNEVALTDGSRFDKLTLMSVAEMTDADFAKSWSFFDFVTKELGKDGQRWLRSACIHGKSKKTFHAKWRPESESIFDITGKDVLKVLENRWKEYAEDAQDISEGGRKK